MARDMSRRPALGLLIGAVVGWAVGTIAILMLAGVLE